MAPEEALRRMGRGVARRPLLASGDAASALRALDDRRRGAYEAAADLTVETSGVRRGEVVARILSMLDPAEQERAPAARLNEGSR